MVPYGVTDGSLSAARGLWYGTEEPTNNTAELRALVDALEFLHGMGWPASDVYPQ